MSITSNIEWIEINEHTDDYPVTFVEILIFDLSLNDVVKGHLAWTESKQPLWIEQITGEPLPRPTYWAKVPFPSGVNA